MSACPECRDVKTKVMQTWVLRNGWTVRRRRCVYGCDYLWLTYEVPDNELSIDADDSLLRPLKERAPRKRR